MSWTLFLTYFNCFGFSALSHERETQSELQKHQQKGFDWIPHSCSGLERDVSRATWGGINYPLLSSFWHHALQLLLHPKDADLGYWNVRSCKWQSLSMCAVDVRRGYGGVGAKNWPYALVTEPDSLPDMMRNWIHWFYVSFTRRGQLR